MVLSQITKKELRQLGVKAVYLFGSRAQGVSGPLSDYDFAILMNKRGHRRGDILYNQLYDTLEPLCPRTQNNDVIDIVFLRDVGLELQFHVIRYGKILYDTSPLMRSRFEQKVQLAYCDFQPILQTFDQAILSSI